MEWKWTKGEPYERSRRIIATKEPVETADNKSSSFFVVGNSLSP